MFKAAIDNFFANRRRERIIDRVCAAPVDCHPYPYFVAEDVLPPRLVSDMLAHWPDRSNFVFDSHNYYFDLVGLKLSGQRQRDFWEAFKQGPVMALAESTIRQFLPWLTARYGANHGVFPGVVSLMEADTNFAGQPAHVHHDHDPGWAGTLLLYLDKDPGGQPGTSIDQLVQGTLDDEIRAAANARKWYKNPAIRPVKTVDYAYNRLFAFLDSPISYHSVGPAKPNATGKRHLFRMHLKVPDHLILPIYGVPLESYRPIRAAGKTDPRVHEWLRKDIEELRHNPRH